MQVEANYNKVVDKFYTIYADEVNPQRAVPHINDGLKLVQRRMFYTLYHDAPNVFKKAAWVIGTCIANYHPHGDMSAFDTLVRMVRACPSLIEKQGTWGHDLTLTGENAAAPRYVECKRGDFFKRYFKYAHMATLVLKDTDELEPDSFCLPIPFALLAGSAGVGKGEGFKIRIPQYELKDLVKRLLHLLKNGKPEENVIVPVYGKGFTVTGDFLKLLTEGTGTMLLTGAYKIDIKKKAIIVTAKPPWVKEKRFLKVLKEYEDQLEIKDYSGRGKTRIQVRIKSRKKDAIDLKTLEKLIIKLVSLKIPNKMKVYIKKYTYADIGVDDWLIYSFKQYKNIAIVDYQNQINKLQDKIMMFGLLEKFIPLYRKHLPLIKNEADFDNFKILTKTTLSINDEILTRLFSYRNSTMLRHKFDKGTLQKEIDGIKLIIKNINKHVIRDYKELLK